jgi:hypothetical protein
LGSLSRDGIFFPFEENAGSVGAVAFREKIDPSTTYTIVDFLYQLIHAKELSLRLQRDKGRWYGGITRKVIYDMIAADLWIRNIKAEVSNGTFNFVVHTDIRRCQVDAIISFAEKMKWPYLAEARKTLNDFVQHGTPVDIRTWDWVAGMALPGSMLPLTLMFGLHQACPSLNKAAPAGTVLLRHANFGFVFTQVSYWRSRSIIGKVLAVLPDLHEIGGWVGPCIAATGLGTYPTPAALVKVHTNAPDMNLKGYAGGDPPFTPSDGSLMWEDAVFPPASEELCVVLRLQMLTVDTEEHNPDEDDSLTAYRAKLDFYLPKVNKMITLTLYTNSIFVAAPPCNGTHRIDPQYTALYTRTIYKVSQLDKAEIKAGETTVINAAGQGG